jgi:flagellin
MALVVNTNVNSLTAQRALAFADSLQGEAMTRLSTGSKINSASDDAAGLAIAQRMTSQVNGLNMAIKNANDGISLTQSVEGALVEVSDMLQRLRELSVQSANDTNTGVDRSAIQEEVNLLVAEITRVSANTRFNNQLVLDGSFTNKQIQVGTESGETINFSLTSTSASSLGAHEVVGDVIAATAGAGNGDVANGVDDADDIILNGNSVTKTIAVAKGDSAKNVAANINAVTGETGVSATAKTYAVLHNEYGEDQTYSLKINGKTTGDFVMSRTNIADAVDKINSISGSTGVTASSTSDNKVTLYSSGGADMLVENEKSLTNLRMKTVKHDGVTAETALAINAVKNDASSLAASTDFYVQNATSGVNTKFTTVTTHNQHEYSTLINNALGTTEGTAAIRVTSTDATALTTGNYYLKQESTGDVFTVLVSGNDAAAWQTGLGNATHFGGDHDGDAKNLTTYQDVTASISGGKVQLAGDRMFGDFNVFSDSTLATNMANQTHANHKVGIEGTGIDVRSADGTVNADTDFIATAAENAAGTTTVVLGGNAGVALIGTEDTAANGGASLLVAQQITITSSGDDSGATVTVTGTNADGSALSETLTGAAAAATVTTINRFQTITGVVMSAASVGTIDVGVEGSSVDYNYKGARNFGDFSLSTAATAGTLQTSSTVTGDIDSQDLALGASGATDSATIQGTMSLKSSKVFSVTQSGTEAAANDNYFTTKASALNTVANVDLRTQAGAAAALAVLDGAIEKISSLRSDLGAIENRLDHTVSNLMNVSVNTESARSRIQDADFAAESAKLAKAQVLKQAGVGMLAQANAGSQLVLQLLQ